jgi:transcriptional regulator with XRE-family HTH domain
MENLSNRIVEWLKYVRETRDLTLVELGEQSGLTHAQLSYIETGKSELTLFSFVRILNAFNYSFTSLYSENIINNQIPIPNIYLQEDKELFEYPTFKIGDVADFVHFAVYRKKAKDFLIPWLKHFVINHQEWTEKAVSTLLDEALTLLTLPPSEREENSLFKDLCYPMELGINKLRQIYLSGGAMILQDPGTYIHEKRALQGISLRNLSEKVSLSHTSLARLEKGFSNRTLFSQVVNIDQALEAEGDLVAIAWRAAETYLGIGRTYEPNTPYNLDQLEWIKRLIILLRIYQHFDLLEDAQAFITDLRKMAVPYLSE